MPTPFPFDPTVFPEMTPADQALIADHHPAARPAFALMLLSFRRYGYFPKTADAFLSEDLAQVERLLATSVDPHAPFRLPPRTAKRFRGEIRRHLHLRPLDAAALSALEDWLRTEAVGHSREAPALAALLADRGAAGRPLPVARLRAAAAGAEPAFDPGRPARPRNHRPAEHPGAPAGRNAHRPGGPLAAADAGRERRPPGAGGDH